MSLKVVLGNLEKAAIEQRSNRDTATTASAAKAAQSNVSSVVTTQQSAVRAAQSTEAVVTTLRAFRSTGSSQPLKDISQAEKLASDVAEKIRDNKDEASGVHSGVSSDKTGPVLV